MPSNPQLPSVEPLAPRYNQIILPFPLPAAQPKHHFLIINKSQLADYTGCARFCENMK
jgi:hypothetical protein